MKIPITKAIAELRHATDCRNFLSYLRNSKNKSKDVSENEFQYFYLWGEMIEGDSFEEIMSGVAMEKERKRDSASVKNKISRRLKRSSVRLVIQAGRCKQTYLILPIPEEIVAEIQRQEEEEK